MLNIRKAGHRDLERFYSAMQVDFKDDELIGKLYLHRALMNGSMELLIVSDDEAKLDLAYALVSVRGLYGYVLLKQLAVLPWYRGQGLGKETMRMLAKRYADKQGILAELPVYGGEGDAERVRRLTKFFTRFGYVPVEAEYRFGGIEEKLLVRPMKGSEEISPIVHRMVPDLYARVLPELVLQKTVDIRAGGSR